VGGEAGGFVRRRSTRAAGLAALAAVLVAVSLASLAVGAKPISVDTAVHALTHYDKASYDETVVRLLRVPRTIVGLLVGAALGLAGAIMQGVTRNPLADPGILGVNGGGALLIVLGVFVFGVEDVHGYVWLAFAGAAAAGVVVYAISSLGRPLPAFAAIDS
jgi:iron complex transport system permease protein